MGATIQAIKPMTVNAASQSMPSDALVVFGATGDLAYKKIFPALQHMIRRSTLDVPVIGVAKSGWTVRTAAGARPRESYAPWGRRRRGGVRQTGAVVALCGRRLPRSRHL